MKIHWFEDRKSGGNCPTCGRNIVVGILISKTSKGETKGQIVEGCPNYEACSFFQMVKQ